MEKDPALQDSFNIERTIKLLRFAQEIINLYNTEEAVAILKQAVKSNLDIIISYQNTYGEKNKFLKDASTAKKINLNRLYEALSAIEFVSMPEVKDE